MLKRRRQAVANQSRAGAKNAGKQTTIYQPSPVDIQNYTRISKFFARAQTSKTTHPKLLTKLLEVYKEVPLEDFTRVFQACLHVPLASNSGCNDATKRIFLFVGNFCAAINNNDGEGILCPLNAHLFTYLLQGSADNAQSVRLRACQLINALLQSLDADQGLEIWLADAIQEAMLKRMRDKSPKVRVQAVSALQRLQDPDNPECPVLTSFMESVRHDPSAEVRCRLLTVMARFKRTIPLLVERHMDERDIVRKAALLVLSRIHMRSLKISQRERVLSIALQDPSPIVRNCAENELLPSWLLNNDGDYFRFLACLDVDTVGPENVCKEALHVLFKKAEAENLVEYANKVLVDKLLPANELAGQLGPQKLVFWCSLVEFFRNERLEEEVDSILPDLTPFCVYMQRVLLGDNLPQNEEDLDSWCLNVSQMLAIAKGFDLGDEMGRSELRRTVVALLSANKSNSLTAPLVQLMEMVEPVVPTRLIALAELVSDLHNPFAPAPQQISKEEIQVLTEEKNKLRFQLMSLTADYDVAIEARDFTAAKTLDEQLKAARLRLSVINKELAPPEEETVVRREATDVETLSQCLNIIFEAMQDPKVTNLTPELRTLMMDFVEPVLQQPDLSDALRLLCLRCLGGFCLLDKKVALEKISIFFVPLAEEGDSACAVASLQIIFDLFFNYGVSAFNISDDIDGRDEYRDENPEAIRDVNVLDSMLFSLRDYEMPALVGVAATGFCKLLLCGHLSSYRLLIALLLAWFHQSETYAELRFALEDFFSTYTSNRIDGLKLMVRCVDPLVDELLKAEEHQNIDISQVLLLVISLTRPGINPNHKENMHLEIAEQMCDKIIVEPEHDRMPFFAQALSRLQLVWGSAEALQSLRAKALEIEPMLAEDKLAKRYMTKFIANITAEEAVLAEEAPNGTGSDEENADEPGEEAIQEKTQPDGTEDEEQMVVDGAGANKVSPQHQNLSDVLAGSSSPINQQLSVSGVVIPESDSATSEMSD